MLKVVRDFAASTADLGLGSVRIWLRLFPQLTAIWLGGWLVTELCTRITTTIPVEYVWFSLLVFALGFLGTLGSIVLMLRLVARHLDLRSLVPDAADDQPVSHVLAITLLPFLGIYAAVNEIARRADELTALTLLQTGLLADHTILSELNPFVSPQRLALVVGLVVGVYVVRRGVDLLHERTEWRWLGVIVAVLEGYFLLIVLMSGQSVINQIGDWWGERQLVQWIDTAGTAIGGFFDLIGLHWPLVLRWIGMFVADTLWPLILSAMVQPIIWLAVAALVFGSHALSVADLWRQGAPLTAQVPVPRRVRRLRAVRHDETASRSARRMWLEFQEVFLGDIDDKYLPTFQSLRLVLRAGATFLGSYVLVYALWEVLSQLWRTVVVQVVGGHSALVWLTLSPITDLVTEGLFEPLRMCLLALAFHRCFALFHDRASTVAPGPTGAPVAVRLPEEVRP